MQFNELSLEAQSIFFGVQNTYSIYDRVLNLIRSLTEKSLKGKIELSQEKLEKSSFLRDICKLGIEELKKEGSDLNFTTEHKKEFKKYFAEWMIDEVKSLQLSYN